MKKIGSIFRENLEQLIDKEIKDNNSFVINYSNVSASEFNNLRLELRKVGARLFITKNTSAKRALSKRKLEHMLDCVQGPTAFVWGGDEAVTVSKVLAKFAKEKEGVKVRGGLLDQEFMDEDRIKTMAGLPSKEILQAMVLRAIQSPITGLVNVLSGSFRQLVYVIKQLSEKKGGEPK
ncbi:MAG: 50S ribosomal protein L10 [Candidatus Omnitrophota bacterium]